jgi:hypothetical protein
MKSYKKMQAILDQGRLASGSPQTMGAIRLVPLLRRGAPGDLRIAERRYESGGGVVRLDGRPEESGLAYMSYVPHGFVVSHTSDGTLAALGTTLGKDKPCFVKLHHRMVKREEPDGATQRFRTLPLHLAMEGFLALAFGGPEILWSDYSEHAVRHGLSPRMETSVSGAYIQGLEDALRVFEINDDQVGVMIFVADALASVFVLSHPDDYRRLHLSVLEDFFGELLANYAVLYPQAAYRSPNVAFAKAATIDDLERAVADVRRETAEEAALLTSGLFGKEVSVERIRAFAPFILERFLPTFQLSEECHIGERIVRDDGSLEYMKTFRLSQAQIRRGHLLSTLARANWDLSAAAELFACSRDELVKRIVNADLGYLLKRQLVERALRA